MTEPQTLVARVTPAVPSAIATLVIRGPAAVELAQRIIQITGNATNFLEVGRVRYGLWNPRNDSAAAEQVVVCRTGPEQIEVHCHGGNAVCELILGDLQQQGCLRCSAFEFPSQYTDDFARDAELDLPLATTERAAAILLDQLNGALGNRIAKIQESTAAGQVEAARELALETLKWSELGAHLATPWQIVLAGPPNVGKSSLLNALVGSQRVIVHHEPGTTRDWVEALTAMDGWPVSITDTAGLRETGDEIESEGMRRALGRVQASDLVIFVIDASQGWTKTHAELWELTTDKRRLVVWNKSDLCPVQDPPAGAIATSCAQEIGLTELVVAIAQSLVPEIPPPLSPVPFRARHLRLLESLAVSDRS